jgi:hypothetical protein
MGLTNVERQRRWRARHPAESLQHLQRLRLAHAARKRESAHIDHPWLKNDALVGPSDVKLKLQQMLNDMTSIMPPTPTPTLQIARKLRQRCNDHNQTETLVKFKGWPMKYNRWLTDAEMIQYQ